MTEAPLIEWAMTGMIAKCSWVGRVDHRRFRVLRSTHTCTEQGGPATGSLPTANAPRFIVIDSWGGP